MKPSFFNGVPGGARKVDLRGRSGAAVKTREELLAEARWEREARALHKAHTQGATRIQALWRGARARGAARAQARAAWRAAFGDAGERLDSSAATSTLALSQLCLFAHAAAPSDVPCIVAACRAALAPDAGGSPALCAAWHAAARDARPVLQLRARRLAALCVAALSRHAAQLAPDLRSASAAAAESPAATLARCITTLTSPAAWRAPRGGDTSPADAVLQRLLHSGALAALRHIIAAVVPMPAAAPQPLLCDAAGGTVLDALVLHLWLRCDEEPFNAAPNVQGAPARLRAAAQLLSLPLLWRRCPGLAAALPALWPAAVRALADALPAASAASPAAVRALLPADPTYPAAAWALGNLLDAAPAALAAAPQQQAQQGRAAAALRFAAVSEALLAAVPRAALGPADVEEEREGGGDVAMGGGGAATSAVPMALDAEAGPPPPALAAQLALVADGALLRDLIHAVLPAPPPASNHGGGNAAAAAGALRLCSLLHCALSALRGPERGRMLAALAFSAGLVPRLWACVRDCADAGAWAVPAATAAGPSVAAAAAPATEPGWLLPLAVLSPVYSFLLLTADDEEFYERGQPLALRDNVRLVSLLRDALWQLLWADAPAGGAASASAAASLPPAQAALRASATSSLARLFSQLHARNGRRAFAPPEAFFREELSRRDALADRLLADGAAAVADADAMADSGGGDEDAVGPGASSSAAMTTRAARLLAAAPALAPFHLRAALFQELCAADREAAHAAAHARMASAFHGFDGEGWQQPAPFGATLTIRRDHLFDDGLEGMGALAAGSLRGPVRIRFVNALGAPEAGVDGGGLFKDFLDDLVRSAFDPRAGLWRTTAAHALYPSPASGAADGAHLQKLRFQGAVLAKALYEGILAELPLAGFFLAKLRGDAMELDDLASLDEPLHRSLLFLKRYAGDHAALCLSFTTADDAGAEVALLPGGRDMPVTERNKLSYIQLVAHYKLTTQLRQQCDAFLQGFHALIRPAWVRMFSADELQQLIGGSPEGVCVDDLCRWCVYSGGYHGEHPTVRLLWECVAELPPAQQAAFLKFVTACSRAPLLGFRTLEPRFCVARAGVPASDAPDEAADLERLPTAATCMNLLKLPPYHRKEDMRQKLLYAISANAGFDLS